MPNLLCHINWLPDYAGTQADYAWIDEHPGNRPLPFALRAHEVLNFLPEDGKMRGYVRVAGNIDTGWLWAAAPGEPAYDVRVIWTATRPEGGRVVVGWYDRATVYPSAPAERPYPLDPRYPIGWRVECAEEDAHLLSQNERRLAVPTFKTHGGGHPGMSALFYVDHFAATMGRWLFNFQTQHPLLPTANAAARRGGWPVRPDAAHNAQVEAAAIAAVISRLGAPHRDRQSDNCGWDLEFIVDGRLTCIEVKGVSGAAVRAQVTPNEYAAIQRYTGPNLLPSDYRLAIVTNALSEPIVHLFGHAEANRWICDEHPECVIMHEERVAAAFGVRP